MSINNGGTHE
jgi:hypothetical protein